MPVSTPPRRPEVEQDRDLEQRVADLEALIEEARRRARRRRIRNGTAIAVAAAAGVTGLIGFHGGGGGAAGPAALTGAFGASGRTAQPAPLGALPPGARPWVFAFDPRRPNVVYIASLHDGNGVYVYETTDGGQHWRPTGAQGSGWVSDILSLTADPAHPGTLFAGTDTAVYKTVDGGRTWRPFNHGLFARSDQRPYAGTPGMPDFNHGNGYVLDAAVDPIHPNVVYAAAGAIRNSTDGGRTWTTVLAPKQGASWFVASRIAIAPTRPESIYAIVHTALGDTVIYRSTDAGKSWQTTGHGSPLPPSCCADSQDALAVDPGNPQTVYAVVGDTILVTTDGGASWHPMANGLPANDVTSLTVDPHRSGTVYAGVQINLNHVSHAGAVRGGIYETTDGGQTWSKIFSGFGVEHVAVDPARPSTIYAAGWAHVDKQHVDTFRLARSNDGGHTWMISS